MALAAHRRRSGGRDRQGVNCHYGKRVGMWDHLFVLRLLVSIWCSDTCAAAAGERMFVLVKHSGLPAPARGPG